MPLAAPEGSGYRNPIPPSSRPREGAGVSPESAVACCGGQEPAVHQFGLQSRQRLGRPPDPFLREHSYAGTDPARHESAVQNLVTIAVPIYKRLQYLPRVLHIVAAQTYPHVQLLVSDNGVNGTTVLDEVKRLYSRPYTFRQSKTSLEVVQHFNQMLQAATGEYLVILADDDQISPEFVSELVTQMERHPTAALGFSRQETILETGAILAKSAEQLPDAMSGPEFIRAAWRRYAFGFQSVSTYLGRTRLMRECGGYPDFTRGTHIDDALVLKLCLMGDVVFSSNCVFRNLVQESSLGWSVSTAQLAAAVRQFIRFLDTDPTTQKFAASNPSEWSELRGIMVEMSWGMYLGRWQGMYRERLSPFQWVRAAFALPLIPAYYTRAFRVLLRALRDGIPDPGKARRTA